MKEQYQEKLSNEIKYGQIVYNNPQESSIKYASISSDDLNQMAEVYQRAFGGPPWFEKFKCGDCQEFSANDKCCPSCNGNAMGEAYPKEELINDYFPTTLSEFTPGTLVNIFKNGKIVGFSTGGMTSLDDLVKIKYKSNPQILDSIKSITGLSPETKVFYDNETCIEPDQQQQGIGSIISSVRFKTAQDLGADIVVGRTINIPWLTAKKNQFMTAGFDFKNFVPNGDTYQVEGNPRQFYIARKVII